MNDMSKTIHSVRKQIEPQDLCKITDDGVVLWNEVGIVEFLETELLIRKLRVGNKIFFGEILGSDFLNYSFEYIKNQILYFLNKPDTYKIWRFLVENNISFSPNILNALKEEIPEMDFGEKVAFKNDEGIFLIDESGEVERDDLLENELLNYRYLPFN